MGQPADGRRVMCSPRFALAQAGRIDDFARLPAPERRPRCSVEGPRRPGGNAARGGGPSASASRHPLALVRGSPHRAEAQPRLHHRRDGGGRTRRLGRGVAVARERRFFTAAGRRDVRGHARAPRARVASASTPVGLPAEGATGAAGRRAAGRSSGRGQQRVPRRRRRTAAPSYASCRREPAVAVWPSYALRAGLEVDAALEARGSRPSGGSFAALAGAPMAYAKRTWNGLMERRRCRPRPASRSASGARLRRLGDDVLDAAAVPGRRRERCGARRLAARGSAVAWWPAGRVWYCRLWAVRPTR